MIVAFPFAAALVALACAVVMGWDALRRPRPERVAWFAAFGLFFVAAAAEVAGAALGWNPALARLYYLTGAVLVVGLLALGEAYLLWPRRMPAATPGVALLVVALAATTVWSAPVDAARLPTVGWHALERGPALVALAVAINAGGTLVLVGGALYSAAMSRRANGWNRRAIGCLLIAGGAALVATGGSLTRLGRPEYLYVAMSAGIGVIFAGVLLTRSSSRPVAALMADDGIGLVRRASDGAAASPGWIGSGGEGLRYIADTLLALEPEALADACRRWSATPMEGDALSREQAKETWALRLLLSEAARGRLDALPLATQAQLAELYWSVWSDARPGVPLAPGAEARRPLAILRPASKAEGEAR